MGKGQHDRAIKTTTAIALRPDHAATFPVVRSPAEQAHDRAIGISTR